MADTADTQPAGASLLQRVRDGEQYWAWKFGMRVALGVLNIIGIGCTGWLLSTTTSFYYDEGWTYLPILIVMSTSFVYCAIMILVQLFRRPPRPVHPGVAVGMDLVFWLAFIVTGLLGVYAIFSLTLWHDSPRSLQDSGSAYYSGHYHQASNGTWIYKIDWVSQDYPNGNDGYHYNATTGTYQYNHNKPALSTVKRDCKPEFNTCAEQDAYVNRLWHTQQRREGPVFLVCVIQWLNLLLHFILFVWACVDTHRRNRSKTHSRTQDIADRVLSDMQARGLVMRATGSDNEARPLVASEAGQGTEMVQRNGRSQEEQDVIEAIGQVR